MLAVALLACSSFAPRAQAQSPALTLSVANGGTTGRSSQYATLVGLGQRALGETEIGLAASWWTRSDGDSEPGLMSWALSLYADMPLSARRPWLRSRAGIAVTQRIDASGGKVWRPALYVSAAPRWKVLPHLGLSAGIDWLQDVRFSTVTFRVGLILSPSS